MLIFVDFLDFRALVFPGILGTVILAIGHRGSEIGAFVCVKSRLSGLYDYIYAILGHRPQGCNNWHYFDSESCEKCVI